MLVDQAKQRDRAERRDLARLDDNRVAGDQRRRELAAEDREREVPRADRRDDPDRGAQEMHDLAGRVTGQDLALEAPVPLRVVAQEPFREVDFAEGLVGRLAHFVDEDLGKLVAVGDDDIGDLAQQRAALDRRGGGPTALGAARSLECRVHFAGRGARDGRDRNLARGIDHIECVAAGRMPGAAGVDGGLLRVLLKLD